MKLSLLILATALAAPTPAPSDSDVALATIGSAGLFLAACKFGTPGLCQKMVGLTPKTEASIAAKAASKATNWPTWSATYAKLFPSKGPVTEGVATPSFFSKFNPFAKKVDVVPGPVITV